jgi:hypothetical protein
MRVVKGKKKFTIKTKTMGKCSKPSTAKCNIPPSALLNIQLIILALPNLSCKIKEKTDNYC